MDTPRFAVIAAAAAAVAWAAKAVAIGLAGGLDKSSWENPLFFLGLTCALTAVGALAVSSAARPQWWARVGAVTGALVALFVIVALTSAAFESVGDHWVWSELSLWVTSLALLALAASRWSRTPSHHRTA